MTEEEERELELLAEEIATESVLGFNRILSDEVVAEMWRMVVDELMCTDEGRRRLRAARKDPVVQKSTEVARRDDAEDVARFLTPAVPGKASNRR